MKFIDLFAGLGGFHEGLSVLGHECVFACEKNETLAKLYEENFSISVFRDIRELNPSDIPKYDILCAGFPCQPFSKAGKQKGLNDMTNGDYLNEVVKILKATKPKFFILENVPNLRKHDRERTWEKIYTQLSDCGYYIKDAILSPHDFGIPQLRKRLFIVGSVTNLTDFEFPTQNKKELSVLSVLDKNPNTASKITQRQRNCLALWQEIISRIPSKNQLPSFPIWGMEFGSTYPYEDKSPFALNAKELGEYDGAFGESLKGLKKKEQMLLLPRYAREEVTEFPEWKKDFIRKNREFFSKYSSLIKALILKLQDYPPSWQKFEWNCLNGNRKIKKYIIQFRASGIRVKKAHYFPALVLTSTQRPIIAWEDRYITAKEASRLQSLNNIKLPESEQIAIRHLGNAVNSKIIELIGRNLIK